MKLTYANLNNPLFIQALSKVNLKGSYPVARTRQIIRLNKELETQIILAKELMQKLWAKHGVTGADDNVADKMNTESWQRDFADFLSQEFEVEFPLFRDDELDPIGLSPHELAAIQGLIEEAP